MGLFDSRPKIYSKDFHKALRGVSGLTSQERDYLEKAFENALKGGLSKSEIERKCRKLRHKTGDPLNPSEVRKVEEELLKYFD